MSWVATTNESFKQKQIIDNVVYTVKLHDIHILIYNSFKEYFTHRTKTPKKASEKALLITHQTTTER